MLGRSCVSVICFDAALSKVAPCRLGCSTFGKSENNAYQSELSKLLVSSSCSSQRPSEQEAHHKRLRIPPAVGVGEQHPQRHHVRQTRDDPLLEADRATWTNKKVKVKGGVHRPNHIHNPKVVLGLPHCSLHSSFV